MNFNKQKVFQLTFTLFTVWAESESRGTLTDVRADGVPTIVVTPSVIYCAFIDIWKYRRK